MPKYFQHPFAENGDRTAVPDESATNEVSYEQGYTPAYELPKTNPDRRNIDRQPFNGLHFDVTENLKFWQENGAPEIVADSGDGSPLSYSKGFVGALAGVTYVALVDGTTTVPPSAEWEVVDFSTLNQRTIYVGSVADLGSITGPIEGAHYSITGYHPGSAAQANPKGGGVVVWKSDVNKADHNGFTVFDPDKTFPTDYTDGTAVDAWYNSTNTGTGCFVRVGFDSLPAEAAGARSGDDTIYAGNTYAMQKAWDVSSETGLKVTCLSEDTLSPYYTNKLYLREGMNIEGTPDKTVIQFPSVLHGASGFFIDREDDGARYRRGRVSGIWFATATSGVTAAQDSNQDLGGVAHVALESWEWSNIRTTGFGQGGIVVARAESGAEGLGFVNTDQDGNYNDFYNITATACGKYRTTESQRAAVVLLFKANSNNFYGVYGRGLPDSATISFEYGSNNNLFGGTGESAPYSVRIGPLAGNNHVYGIRGEGVTHVVRAYAYTGIAQDDNGPLVWNTIYGPHLSSGTGEIDADSGANTWIAATGNNPLRFRRAISDSASTRPDGLLDVLGLKCQDASGDPVYIMSAAADGRESNGANYVPRLQLRNNFTNPTSGTKIAGIEFYNSDTSTGASGISASLDAVIADGSGTTDLVFQAGNGTNREEKMRIKGNGRINMSDLPASSSGLAAGDLWNDAGTLKIV